MPAENGWQRDDFNENVYLKIIQRPDCLNPAIGLPPSTHLMEPGRAPPNYRSSDGQHPNVSQSLSDELQINGQHCFREFFLVGDQTANIYFNDLVIILQKCILMSHLILIHQFKVKMAPILPQYMLNFLDQERLQVSIRRQRIS